MGNRMRTYRLEAGLTLEQLAERMGTSVQQVSRLEKGQRKLTQDWMLRAAAALGIPPAALFDTAQPPDVGEMVKDRSEISLLRFWRDLDGSQRELFVKMLGAESGEIDDAA
jgi:transcriptional regulator with XRE-family HTH domain